MQKTVIRSFCSAGIIFRRSDPQQIFLEKKDGGHPTALFRHKLFPVGGNWIGPEAKHDQGPLDTFRRKVGSEFRNFGGNIGMSEIVLTMKDDCTPFGVFEKTISGESFRSADPDSKLDTTMFISCYWMVGLNDRRWKTLQGLQECFGNLSGESISLFTSLKELNDGKLLMGAGHDQLFQRFFLAMGLSEAKNMPIARGIEVRSVGTALASYADYLKHYEITQRP